MTSPTKNIVRLLASQSPENMNLVQYGAMDFPTMAAHVTGRAFSKEREKSDRDVAQKFVRDERRWTHLVKALAANVPRYYMSLYHLDWLGGLTPDSGIEDWQIGRVHAILRDIQIPEDISLMMINGMRKVFLRPTGDTTFPGSPHECYDWVTDPNGQVLNLDMLFRLSESFHNEHAKRVLLDLVRNHFASMQRIQIIGDAPDWYLSALQEKTQPPPVRLREPAVQNPPDPAYEPLTSVELEKVSQERGLDLSKTGGHFQALLFATLEKAGTKPRPRNLQEAHQVRSLSFLHWALPWSRIEKASYATAPLRLCEWRFALGLTQKGLGRALDISPAPISQFENPRPSARAKRPSWLTDARLETLAKLLVSSTDRLPSLVGDL